MLDPKDQNAHDSASEWQAEPISTTRVRQAAKLGAPLTSEEHVRMESMIQRSNRRDPHELLGVSREASKKQVRDAYFVLARECHPDRYYSRDLGNLKAPLERAFARVTNAYEEIMAMPVAVAAEAPVSRVALKAPMSAERAAAFERDRRRAFAVRLAPASFRMRKDVAKAG